ncbi:MAG TPA: acetate kinase [Candidatus Acidoferrales bacterium]|nr:acetate kinase [Candidatus Acidoferrales bacterium]
MAVLILQPMKILVLNSGSSTQKSSLYELEEVPPENPPAPIWQGKIEWNGDQAEITARSERGATLQERAAIPFRKQAIVQLLESLWSGAARVISSPAKIDIVGHRVVHGGSQYEQPTIITPEVETVIERLSAFAPLHNRAELEAIHIVEEKIGVVPQVAVFDTGFHYRMPQSAAVYGGPYEWFMRGIRRYGFHGINHQYCAERTAQLLGRELNSLKIVTCHLGSGCSLAAIRDGHSVDTTMGFTPIEGLMMGTRSGSVDPGILTYLLRHGEYSPQQLDDVLNTKSGLLGISGLSSDMRAIQAAMKQGHSRAKLAFDIFVHRLRWNIGAMVAVLGGIDALVFTAGIGENSPDVREAACAEFNYLGIELDAEKNAQLASDQDISARNSAVRVLVVCAQEDWAIARECWKLARAKNSTAANSSST